MRIDIHRGLPMRRFTAFLFCAVLPAWALAGTAPPQPKEGPGGADYVASEVVKIAIGTLGAQSFVFYGKDAPGPRPVIVFLHAWGAANPKYYGAWIDHLARKGHVVVFPRYQELNRTPIGNAPALAGTALKQAAALLRQDETVKPDFSRTAFIGHVAGATVATDLAALKDEDIPIPKLVMALMPGGIAANAKARGIPLGDLSRIEAETLLVTVIGDRDAAPSDRAARRILKEAVAVPPSRKLFIRLLSDDHGYPPLSATLAAPAALDESYDETKIPLPPNPPLDAKQAKARWRWSADMALTGEQTVLVSQIQTNPKDSLDYTGLWKTLDLALKAAFLGQDTQNLRLNPALYDMGNWSDGWPVKRLGVEAVKGETKKLGK